MSNLSGIVRELGTRVDLAGATGSGHALRRMWQDLRHASRNSAYRDVAGAIWSTAAGRVGAEVVVRDSGFFAIERDGMRVWAYEQTPAANNVVAVLLAEDKSRVYGLLAAEGLTVPEHLEFRRSGLRSASQFLARAAAACVVKPATSSSGFGVTSHVRTAADLRRAVWWSGRFGERLLIERQAEGDVYRVLVFDGDVIDVIRCRPPSVLGDGRSTIAQLVEAEYERRIQARGMAGVRPLAIDLDAVLTLRDEGRSPHDVPEAGAIVHVKTVTNQNRRADNEALATPLPAALIAAAQGAASALGLRLAGVDIVTVDPHSGLAGAAAIIDVNPRPGLWHHFEAVRGDDRDVCAEILNRLFQPR